MSRLRLVDEDAGEVVHGPPEPGPVGAGLPEAGEELGGERVVDDGDLHGGMMAADGPGHARRHDRPHAPRRRRPPPPRWSRSARRPPTSAWPRCACRRRTCRSPRGSGSGIDIATVIGFPSGAHQPAVKAHEAEVAVDAGATELDMVVNLGLVKAGRVAGGGRRHRGRARVDAGPRAAQGDPRDGRPHRRRRSSRRAASPKRAGADYVKTSTGFHPAGGASVARGRAHGRHRRRPPRHQGQRRHPRRRHRAGHGRRRRHPARLLAPAEPSSTASLTPSVCADHRYAVLSAHRSASDAAGAELGVGGLDLLVDDPRGAGRRARTSSSWR